MIRAVAPLRISLGGGGTDLPSYYLGRGAYFVAMAINLTVRVTVSADLSSMGDEAACENLDSPLTRAALLRFGRSARGFRVQSRSDVPSGSGLGSSGAYLVALIAALQEMAGEPGVDDPAFLAEAAFHTEAADVGRHVGKQDHLTAAWGGLREYRIDANGGVQTRLLGMHPGELTDRIVLLHFGPPRDAAEMLARRDSFGNTHERQLILGEIAQLGEAAASSLERGDLDTWSTLVAQHWKLKLRMSPNPVNQAFDDFYRQCAARYGVTGGKLLGAGGGGFAVLCSDSLDAKEKLTDYLGEQGMTVRGFGSAPSGVTVTSS